MSETLATLSGLVMIVVVVFYFMQVAGGSSTPNPATWFIWLVVMAMNVVTYYFVSNGNFWPVLTPSIITLGILLIFIYSFNKGRLGKLGWMEWMTLGLAVVVGIFWQVTKDGTASNLMMQIILLIAFVPTVIGVISGKLKEKPLSWITAVISYVLLIASILCNDDWTWVQLAYPFFNGIVGNGSVALATQARRKKAPTED